jgi:hypothetical protein
MIHFQISVKLNEALYNRLMKTASAMRMNKHAFVVTSVEETLDMIDKRGCEKVPLLVVQARTAHDYIQQAPALPVRVDTVSPEKPSECPAPESRKRVVANRGKPAGNRGP